MVMSGKTGAAGSPGLPSEEVEVPELVFGVLKGLLQPLARKQRTNANPSKLGVFIVDYGSIVNATPIHGVAQHL
jgi:hypothetical protein